MTKKTIAAALMTTSLTFGMVACGNDSGYDPKNPTQEESDFITSARSTELETLMTVGVNEDNAPEISDEELIAQGYKICEAAEQHHETLAEDASEENVRSFMIDAGANDELADAFATDNFDNVQTWLERAIKGEGNGEDRAKFKNYINFSSSMTAINKLCPETDAKMADVS